MSQFNPDKSSNKNEDIARRLAELNKTKNLNLEIDKVKSRDQDILENAKKDYESKNIYQDARIKAFVETSKKHLESGIFTTQEQKDAYQQMVESALLAMGSMNSEAEFIKSKSEAVANAAVPNAQEAIAVPTVNLDSIESDVDKESVKNLAKKIEAGNTNLTPAELELNKKHGELIGQIIDDKRQKQKLEKMEVARLAEIELSGAGFVNGADMSKAINLRDQIDTYKREKAQKEQELKMQKEKEAQELKQNQDRIDWGNMNADEKRQKAVERLSGMVDKKFEFLQKDEYTDDEMAALKEKGLDTKESRLAELKRLQKIGSMSRDERFEKLQKEKENIEYLVTKGYAVSENTKRLEEIQSQEKNFERGTTQKYSDLAQKLRDAYEDKEYQKLSAKKESDLTYDELVILKHKKIAQEEIKNKLEKSGPSGKDYAHLEEARIQLAKKSQEFHKSHKSKFWGAQVGAGMLNMVTFGLAKANGIKESEMTPKSREEMHDAQKRYNEIRKRLMDREIMGEYNIKNVWKIDRAQIAKRVENFSKNISEEMVAKEYDRLQDMKHILEEHRQRPAFERFAKWYRDDYWASIKNEKVRNVVKRVTNAGILGVCASPFVPFALPVILGQRLLRAGLAGAVGETAAGLVALAGDGKNKKGEFNLFADIKKEGEIKYKKEFADLLAKEIKQGRAPKISDPMFTEKLEMEHKKVILNYQKNESALRKGEMWARLLATGITAGIMHNMFKPDEIIDTGDKNPPENTPPFKPTDPVVDPVNPEPTIPTEPGGGDEGIVKDPEPAPRPPKSGDGNPPRLVDREPDIVNDDPTSVKDKFDAIFERDKIKLENNYQQQEDFLRRLKNARPERTGVGSQDVVVFNGKAYFAPGSSSFMRTIEKLGLPKGSNMIPQNSDGTYSVWLSGSDSWVTVNSVENNPEAFLNDTGISLDQHYNNYGNPSFYEDKIASIQREKLNAIKLLRANVNQDYQEYLLAKAKNAANR
jgi:hypothetical protein